MTAAEAAAPVLTEVRGRVLLVTLNRPKARNAIDTGMSEGLLKAFARLDDEPELAAGVLTGADGLFCSGMDLKAFVREGTPKGLEGLLHEGSRKPLVAAIEGYALAGGLELALTCDLLVAAKGAKLGIPEVSVGLFAAGGALVRLPCRVPYGIAAQLAFTGEPITAEQAYGVGLVNLVTAPGAALDGALELAQRIARNAPLATAASKQVLRACGGRTEEELWDVQKPLIKTVFRSADAKEGPRAFAEKRSPRWTAS